MAGKDVVASGSSDDEITKGNAAAWPLWKLALVALPQLAVQVLWSFIGPNSAPYMKHLGATDTLATLNNIAGPITGFFTGPLVGAISDNCTSRFGRRRPVIAAGLISTWIAGMCFSGSELMFPEGKAIYFAAPMYWVMDITINILQTPFRALVSDLATEDQQLPMQVVFVFLMSVGNFTGFSIMQIYEVPVEHMFELMLGICCLLTFCIGIQFLVARETPIRRDPLARTSACAPVMNVVEAVKGSPKLLYHLAFVQCLVWIGNTAWNLYAGQWIENGVFMGDEGAPHNSTAYALFEEGNRKFSQGGQMKSGVQLVATLCIIGILVNTSLRPRTVYAPCIYIGAVVSLAAAFLVHHNGDVAQLCLALSVMPETGSFAIPFGLVAVLNAHAAKEGKQVSTGLQMALLNCCVTVGQQICTMILAMFESQMSLTTSLTMLYIVAAIAQIIAGSSVLCLNDSAPGSADSDASDESGSEVSEE